MAAFSTGKGFVTNLRECNLSLVIRNSIDADTVDSAYVRVKFCHFGTFLVACLCFNLTSVYSQWEFR